MASRVAIAAVGVAVGDLALIVACFRRRTVLGALAGVAGVGAVVVAAVHGWSGPYAKAAVVIAAILLIVGAVLLALVDTTRALYLWEWPFYPQFLIPVDDVDPDALIDEQQTHRLSRGTVASVGLRAGGAERAGGERRYVESSIGELVGRIRFDWDALDAWYEEDEQVFVHPRTPTSGLMHCDPLDAFESNETAWRSRNRLRRVMVFETPADSLLPGPQCRRFFVSASHRDGHRVSLQGTEDGLLVGSARPRRVSGPGVVI